MIELFVFSTIFYSFSLLLIYTETWRYAVCSSLSWLTLIDNLIVSDENDSCDRKPLELWHKTLIVRDDCTVGVAMAVAVWVWKRWLQNKRYDNGFFLVFVLKRLFFLWYNKRVCLSCYENIIKFELNIR